jgi:hypothetical protein
MSLFQADPIKTTTHRSSRRPLKNRCRTLPSADFALYSISASRSGSTAIGDALAVGLGLADQRRKASAKHRRARGVEPMVDLAGIDQHCAFAPADVKPIPLVAVKSKARDGQRLALRAGFLDPIIRSAGRVFAVSHLGNDALKPGLAGVLLHLSAIDLEALAELNCGVGNQLLQKFLAFEQGQLPQEETKAKARDFVPSAEPKALLKFKT